MNRAAHFFTLSDLLIFVKMPNALLQRLAYPRDSYYHQANSCFDVFKSLLKGNCIVVAG